MEERMTVCNMSIEAGARAGMIAPDDTTYQYMAGRPLAPQGAAWGQRRSSAGARCRATRVRSSNKEVRIDVTELRPMITFGTNPGHGHPDRRCRARG